MSMVNLGTGDRIADPRTFAAGPPHELFAQLREQAAVQWISEPPRAGESSDANRSGYWAVLRHAEVDAASRDPSTFSSAVRGAFLRDTEGGRHLLVNLDGEPHLRVRRFVNAAFVRSSVRRLEGSIRSHAETAVQGVLARGEFDVVTDLAAELPLLVLAELLAIPRQDRHMLFDWSNRLVGFDDPDYGGGSVEAYQQTMMEVFRYGLDIAIARRRDPGDDLLSRVLAAEVDGQRISEAEFCHLWLLLVVAGHETTRHLIASGLHALATHPAQRDRLSADPSLIPTCVDELVRYITPIMQFRRTATRDVVLGGQPIVEGDRVVLYFIAANRDPRVFADPDRLDVGRKPNPHVSFGCGPHFCLGAHLVRLEATVLLELLLPHLPDLRVRTEPQWIQSNFMNAMKTCTMAFDG